MMVWNWLWVFVAWRAALCAARLSQLCFGWVWARERRAELLCPPPRGDSSTSGATARRRLTAGAARRARSAPPLLLLLLLLFLLPVQFREVAVRGRGGSSCFRDAHFLRRDGPLLLRSLPSTAARCRRRLSAPPEPAQQASNCSSRDPPFSTESSLFPPLLFLLWLFIQQSSTTNKKIAPTIAKKSSRFACKWAVRNSKGRKGEDSTKTSSQVDSRAHCARCVSRFLLSITRCQVLFCPQRIL